MVRVKYSSELYHHGIKGQKWGIRRYQNEDGTLTPEGKLRYGVGKTNHTVSSSNLKDPNTKAYLEKFLSRVSEAEGGYYADLVKQGGKLHFSLEQEGWKDYTNKYGKNTDYLGRYGYGKNKFYVYATTPNNTKKWKKYNQYMYNSKGDGGFGDWMSEDEMAEYEDLVNDLALYPSNYRSRFFDKYVDKDKVTKDRERNTKLKKIDAIAAAGVFTAGALGLLAASAHAGRKDAEKDQQLKAGNQPNPNKVDQRRNSK